MLSRFARIIAVCAALGNLGAVPAGGAPKAILERVVVVMRHGVRAPTKSVDVLSKYSVERWPDWSVGVGELTPHGAENIRLMGAWLRSMFAAKGLMSAHGCPAYGEVYAWADGADQRTRMSGDALMEGVFPGCDQTAHHGPNGVVDPLFDAVAGNACPIDPSAARVAVLARVNGDLDHPGPAYEAAKSALGAVLVPTASAQPCTDAQNACFLAGHNGLQVKDGDLRLVGPLATSSTLAESLLLEYAEGLPTGSVGWGRAASETAISAVMPLHEMESDLMRRTPYLAAHRGALLARAVADAVDGQAALPGEDGPGARLVVLVGHDTSLSYLAGILGVDWTLPDQPDKTAPDAAMVFEVWRNPGSGGQFVKIALAYQTLAQLRDATPLDRAHPGRWVDLALPDCVGGPDGACPTTQFRSRIRAVVPAACHR